jgi:hypothetical protein
MGTFNKAVADLMVKNGGWTKPDSEDDPHDAPDNPGAIVIVEYDNAFGGVSYGVTFVGERNPYRYMNPSASIKNPRIYWEADAL